MMYQPLNLSSESANKIYLLPNNATKEKLDACSLQFVFDSSSLTPLETRNVVHSNSKDYYYSKYSIGAIISQSIILAVVISLFLTSMILILEGKKIHIPDSLQFMKSSLFVALVGNIGVFIIYTLIYICNAYVGFKKGAIRFEINDARINRDKTLIEKLVTILLARDLANKDSNQTRAFNVVLSTHNNETTGHGLSAKITEITEKSQIAEEENRQLTLKDRSIPTLYLLPNNLTKKELDACSVQFRYDTTMLTALNARNAPHSTAKDSYYSKYSIGAIVSQSIMIAIVLAILLSSLIMAIGGDSIHVPDSMLFMKSKLFVALVANVAIFLIYTLLYICNSYRGFKKSSIRFELNDARINRDRIIIDKLENMAFAKEFLKLGINKTIDTATQNNHLDASEAQASEASIEILDNE